MPYDQIFCLIVALVLVIAAPSGQGPALSLGMLALLWLLKALAWVIISLWLLSRTYIRSNIALQRLQWLSLVPLIADLYLLDIKTYLLSIPGTSMLPSLIEIIGIGLYLLYLILLWSSYWWLLYKRGLSISPLSEELRSRIGLILPALLMYLVLSVSWDLLDILPLPKIQNLLKAPWIQPIIFIVSMILMLYYIPSIICIFWRCRPIAQGPLRRLIEGFLKKNGIYCRDILFWPLDRGRSCTAAVLGLIPRSRYILLTPCISDHMLPEEIEAILSHEIAHIRYRHLLWYIFFLGVYLLILYRSFDPLETWLLSHYLFLEVLTRLQDSHRSIIPLLTVFPQLILFILYFRFIMGYFIRNFERQADLFAFRTQGHPWNLINALEKIAILAGGIRNRPCWHHFSIAQRVNFLERVARQPDLREEHNRRLSWNKRLFICISGLIIIVPSLLPVQSWRDLARRNFTQVYIEQLIGHGERRPDCYIALGQILAQKQEYDRALKVYRQGLDLAPDNAELLNDIAWLYATADRPEFRRPKEALKYASMAVRRKPAGYILDTFAESLFINGYINRAITAEKRALKRDPSRRAYYQSQIKRFKMGKNLDSDTREESNHGDNFSKE